MRRSLMEILCCPVCKGDLLLTVTEENDERCWKGLSGVRYAMLTIPSTRVSRIFSRRPPAWINPADVGDSPQPPGD